MTPRICSAGVTDTRKADQCRHGPRNSNNLSETKLMRRFGWLPELPDIRDYRYAAPRRLLRALPAAVDLRQSCPSVRDQGPTGACTGFAWRAAYSFLANKQGKPFDPSPLFIYYLERTIENSVKEDSGAFIRDGAKALADMGICSEKSWPFSPPKVTKRPTSKAYTEAKRHQSLQYKRVENTDIDQLKGCLADGRTIVFGISVYNSMMTPAVDKSGNIPMPKGAKDELLGGHAVLCVGYNDSKKRFNLMNSWGTGWGAKGFGTAPYAYLTDTNLADDFWTLEVVE